LTPKETGRLIIGLIILVSLNFASRFDSWKSDTSSSALKLRLKVSSQQEQESQDTEAEDATVLEAATKQRNKGCEKE
jgi:hypothetical protein